MPLRARNLKLPTYLESGCRCKPILTPTEVDHYQLQRTIDVYVAPSGEDLGKPAKEISKIVADTQTSPKHSREYSRPGDHNAISFRSFGFGLLLVRAACLSRPCRAVFFVRRPVFDHSGRSYRTRRA